MKVTNAAVTLCFLLSLNLNSAQAAPSAHSLRGVVITTEGTVVPKFSVIVKHVSDKPELLARKHFKNGEFTIEGLKSGKYQLQISAPTFITSKLVFDFTAEAQPTDYSIVVLHSFRTEARVSPGMAQTVSVRTLKRKVPDQAVAAYRKAVELHREGKLEEALIEYGAALRAYPEYMEALSDIGTIFILYNRPDAALSFLRRAQAVDDCNSIVNLNIAIALGEQGQMGEAMKLLKKVLQADPRMAMAQFFMGKIHYMQKKYDLAESAVRRAVDSDPQMVDAWLLLVDISVQQRKFDEAREALMHIRQAMNNQMVSRFIDERLLALGS